MWLLYNQTLESNKNGIGALDGLKCHIRDQFRRINAVDSHITAASFDQVSTVDLDLLLN